MYISAQKVAQFSVTINCLSLETNWARLSADSLLAQEFL